MKHFRVISTRSLALVAVSYVVPFIARAEVKLENPLGTKTNSIDDILANIITVFLGAVGGIALFVFVYGGTLMLISAGNPEKVKKGQSAMVWAALGLIFIFGSYGMAQFLFQLIGG